MKKKLAVILIVLSLGTLSWAQGKNEPFDVKKSQEELEIMKGILKTTLSFINQEEGISNWRNPRINAFYLADQGAVFIIPATGFSLDFAFDPNLEIASAMEEVRGSLNELRMNLPLETLEDGTMVAPAPPAPPEPPAPPLASKLDQKKLQMKVEEFRKQAEQRREERLKRREKLIQSLDEIKIHLIESLSNYGDSLTMVKPDEHINLVLTTQGFENRQETRFDTISAKKSWVTDYKAGRISLEDFKQKVLQYTQ